MEPPSCDRDLTIIERVLKLRKLMGLGDGLSMGNPRDVLFFPPEEALEDVLRLYDCQRWLAWPKKADDEPGPS